MVNFLKNIYLGKKTFDSYLIYVKTNDAQNQHFLVISPLSANEKQLRPTEKVSMPPPHLSHVHICSIGISGSRWRTNGFNLSDDSKLTCLKTLLFSLQFHCHVLIPKSTEF